MRGRLGTKSGLAAIARALRVASVHTVLEYTKRRVDKLRLKEHPAHGRRIPWQTAVKIEAWRRRSLGTSDEKAACEVTFSWESMALLADTTAAAARELARRDRDPLPVQPTFRRNPETGRMERWAYTAALTDWIDANAIPYELQGGATTRDDVCPPPKAAKSGRKEAA